MIRPITVLTFILACGSGMYLYHAKHRVHVLDQQIGQTVRQTETLREQTRALHAEWMLMNDPDRLHRLSAQYLTTLQPVAPTQFTDLADLDGRLPAPVAPAPAPSTELVASAPAGQVAAEQATAEEAADQTQVAASDQPADASALPVPPSAPPAPPPEQPAVRPVIAQAPARPPARVAEVAAIRPQPVRPIEHVAVWKPAAPRPVIAEAAPARFAQPRPMPAMRPQPVAQPAFGGSMLGMARGTPNLPPPRPVPLNASFSGDNTGG